MFFPFMSPASHLDGCTRRAPSQHRGQQRVARLLDAAVGEFAQAGWEATTMSAIARRAQSPICSLYQFFPNKESVARALRTRQIGDLQDLWLELGSAARSGSLEQFVERYVESVIAFVQTHPAFLPLLDAPSSTLPVGPRNRLRKQLEALLRGLEPRLPPLAAVRHAEVVLTLNKALMSLYARSGAEDRRWVADEFRTVLRAYLEARVLRRAGVRRRTRSG
jgi:AcrR family transcriptional regulator